MVVADSTILSLLYPDVYFTSPIELRNRGFANLFYALQLILVRAHGEALNRRHLLGIFGESEMKGQAHDPVGIRFTYARLKAHIKTGAKIMMLVRKEDGKLWTPHCQPRLSSDQRRTILHLVVNFANVPGETRKSQTEEEAMELARQIVHTYLDNFLYEKFDTEEVEDVRKFIEKRFQLSISVAYLDDGEIPDMCELAESDQDLKAQIKETLGGLERHRTLVLEALSSV